VLSAIARHAEVALQGAVGHAGEGAVQLSGVSSQAGGGKAPGAVVHGPPPLLLPPLLLLMPLLLPVPLLLPAPLLLPVPLLLPAPLLLPLPSVGPASCPGDDCELSLPLQASTADPSRTTTRSKAERMAYVFPLARCPVK
jgi:hypothetical protein